MHPHKINVQSASSCKLELEALSRSIDIQIHHPFIWIKWYGEQIKEDEIHFNLTSLLKFQIMSTSQKTTIR